LNPKAVSNKEPEMEPWNSMRSIEWRRIPWQGAKVEKPRDLAKSVEFSYKTGILKDPKLPSSQVKEAAGKKPIHGKKKQEVQETANKTVTNKTTNNTKAILPTKTSPIKANTTGLPPNVSQNNATQKDNSSTKIIPKNTKQKDNLSHQMTPNNTNPEDNLPTKLSPNNTNNKDNPPNEIGQNVMNKNKNSTKSGLQDNKLKNTTKANRTGETQIQQKPHEQISNAKQQG